MLATMDSVEGRRSTDVDEGPDDEVEELVEEATARDPVPHEVAQNARDAFVMRPLDADPTASPTDSRR
jgi:hypothetical protein